MLRKWQLGVMKTFSEIPDVYNTNRVYQEKIYDMFRTVFTPYYISAYMNNAAQMLLATNPTLSDAMEELHELNAAGNQAIIDTSEYIKSLNLPKGISESASTIGIGEDGKVHASFLGTGIKAIVDKGAYELTDKQIDVASSVTLSYTAEELYEENENILESILGTLKIMADVRGMAEKRKHELETGLRFALVHSIKQYAIATLDNAHWYSPKDWSRRMKLTPMSCETLISEAALHEAGVNAFDYDAGLGKFRDAIKAARQNRLGPEPDDTVLEMEVLTDDTGDGDVNFNPSVLGDENTEADSSGQ